MEKATINRLPLACLAPPFTDGDLARYRGLIDRMEDSETKDALKKCCNACEKWWELPDTTQRGQVYDGAHVQGPDGMRTMKTFEIKPMEPHHIQQLDEHVPWPGECDHYQRLFDALPHGTREEGDRVIVIDHPAWELRNCAFHLLWHCVELAHDREPTTHDQLK